MPQYFNLFLEVDPSSAWKEAREKLPVPEFTLPFDWTYTTAYKGTMGPGVRVESNKPCDAAINFERLKRPDPILFYDEIGE